MNRGTHAPGFTLVEVLIAAGITSTIALGLLTASVTIQRSFSATTFHATAQGDQLRVIDFLTRDLRRASAAVATNQGRKLTLSMPDDIDPASRRVRTPTIRTDGRVLYGGTPREVSYFIEGADFIREENGADAVISSTIEEFFAELRGSSIVSFSLAFSPHYSGRRSAATTAATTLRSTVFLRNVRP